MGMMLHRHFEAEAEARKAEPEKVEAPAKKPAAKKAKQPKQPKQE